MNARVKIAGNKTISTAEVQAELDRLQAEQGTANAEYLRLLDCREGVLRDGTDEDLAAHDVAMARAKNRAERMALKRERLLPELDVAEAQEEQCRRREVYAAARKARSDAVAAIEEYDAAAERLAKLARRIAAGTFAVNEANRDLPEGAAPLDLPEPYNGAPGTPAEYVEQTVREAVRRDTGAVMHVYRPDDPNILLRERKTGQRVQTAPAWPGRPHQSFLTGLRIPSRVPGKNIY